MTWIIPTHSCTGMADPLYRQARGWRGQVPRQPGQVRKEAAVTSPTWVVVQPLTQSPSKLLTRNKAIALKGLEPFLVPEQLSEWGWRWPERRGI